MAHLSDAARSDRLFVPFESGLRMNIVPRRARFSTVRGRRQTGGAEGQAPRNSWSLRCTYPKGVG